MKDEFVQNLRRAALGLGLLVLAVPLAPISMAQAQSNVGTEQKDAERQCGTSVKTT